MHKVFKYTLKETRTEIEMPSTAKILCVQVQHEEPQIWALVPDNPAQSTINTRVFLTFGTGHEIHNKVDLDYIGTFQMDGGHYVGHVFEFNPINF